MQKLLSKGNRLNEKLAEILLVNVFGSAVMNQGIQSFISVSAENNPAGDDDAKQSDEQSHNNSGSILFPSGAPCILLLQLLQLAA